MHLPNADWWVRKNIFSEPFLSPPRKIYRSTTNGLTCASYKHSLQARDRKRQHPSTSGLVNRLERLAGTSIERVQQSLPHGYCLPVLRNRACGISPLRYMGLFLLQIKKPKNLLLNQSWKYSCSEKALSGNWDGTAMAPWAAVPRRRSPGYYRCPVLAAISRQQGARRWLSQ